MKFGDGTGMENGADYRFGNITIDPARRTLLIAGEQIAVGSRAFDIFLALARRPGDIVSKDELMMAAWGSTIVEENTLAVHVAALRRALGDRGDGARLVQTIQGRGYRFVPLAMTGAEGSADAVKAGSGGLAANGHSPPARPPPQVAPPRSKLRLRWFGAAAAVLVACLLVGWSAHRYLAGRPSAPLAWSPQDPRQSIAIASLSASGDEPALREHAHALVAALAAAFSPDLGSERLIVPSASGGAPAAHFLLSLDVHRSGENAETTVLLTDAAGQDVLMSRRLAMPLGTPIDPTGEEIVRLRYDLATAALVREQARVAAERPADRDARDLLIAFKCVSATEECIDRFPMLERAMTLAPDEPHVLGEYAANLSWRVVNNVSKQPQQDLARASAAAYRVLSTQHHQLAALKALVNVSIARSRWDDDLIALDQILGVEPNNSWALGEKGFALLSLGRFDDAEAPVTRALALRTPGNDFFLLELLGYLRFAQGRDAEAMEWLRKSFLAAPAEQWDEPEVARLWAYVAAAAAFLGREEEARAALADFHKHAADVKSLTDLDRWRRGMFVVVPARLSAGLLKAGLPAS